VLIPVTESELIESLTDRDLDEVRTDRWAVSIRSGRRGWMLFPVEVAYAEGDPILDVERIAIKEVEPDSSPGRDLGRDLGKVERIYVARTLRAYFPAQPHAGGERMVDGRSIKIPPSVGYRWVEVAPHRLADEITSRPELRALHFIAVDEGLVFETDQHRVLVRTSGYSAEGFIDPAPDNERLTSCDLVPLGFSPS
jgi:hypothetical protein